LLHPLPQPPQFVVLDSALSQPLTMSPSQSPKPLAEHIGAQVPALQLVLPFGLVHESAQPPQLASVSEVLVSQPLAGLPSQSAQPSAHSTAQLPPAHDALPCPFSQAVGQ
jgi:hypothetical protein